MIIRVFDLETTGLPEDGKATGIIQVGWTDVIVAFKTVTVSDRTEQYFVNPFRSNPTLEMEPGASAAHHIDKADLADAPSIEPILRKLVDGADAFAAHNKEHDGHYFTGAGKPFVCTLKAAQRVWPTMERHSNQFLRYALKLPIDRARADPAHWAGPDSYVTAVLLAAIFAEGATIEDMLEWDYTPRLMPSLPFGKHRGEPLESVPTGYLKFMRDKDLKPDAKFTINYHLEKRGE